MPAGHVHGSPQQHRTQKERPENSTGPSTKTALLTRCGAVPPHFRNEATLYLDKRLSDPMVRCAGPTEWPTRSPDLTHVNHSWAFQGQRLHLSTATPDTLTHRPSHSRNNVATM